ncbi:MAG: hypothetical protein ACI9T8_000216 [Candidatus Saccharimonadales bacterium]|jgi:hypothetical protein
MATVNEDGSPHNTPLFFIYNDDFTKIYWGSHPNSQHSRNIERTRLAYIVVFDSKVWGQGGLYITLKNAHCVSDDDLSETLRVHNDTRKRWGKQPLEISYYQQDEGQRMYSADISKIESYEVTRNDEGRVVEEIRKPIEAKDLGF